MAWLLAISDDPDFMEFARETAASMSDARIAAIAESLSDEGDRASFLRLASAGDRR